MNYKKTITNYVTREVLLIDKGEEVGHFTIMGKSIDGECFGKSTCSMTIFLEEGYKNKGLSREMMKYMFEHIDYPLRENQRFFIDTDASNGFWDHIGMRANPLYDSKREVIGRGYEKVISWREIKKFLKNI